MGVWEKKKEAHAAETKPFPKSYIQESHPGDGSVVDWRRGCLWRGFTIPHKYTALCFSAEAEIDIFSAEVD